MKTHTRTRWLHRQHHRKICGLFNTLHHHLHLSQNITSSIDLNSDWVYIYFIIVWTRAGFRWVLYVRNCSTAGTQLLSWTWQYWAFPLSCPDPFPVEVTFPPRTCQPRSHYRHTWMCYQPDVPLDRPDCPPAFWLVLLLALVSQRLCWAKLHVRLKQIAFKLTHEKLRHINSECSLPCEIFVNTGLLLVIRAIYCRILAICIGQVCRNWIWIADVEIINHIVVFVSLHS